MEGIGASVNVNILTVVHKDSGGIAKNFPDVCKTPSPAGHIPYPNIAMSSDTTEGSKEAKEAFRMDTEGNLAIGFDPLIGLTVTVDK